MSKKVVSITGGRGFVGSQLAQEHLKRGDEVRVLSRKQNDEHGFKYFKGDLTNFSKSNLALLVDFIKDSHVVYHCAGEIHNQSTMHNLHVDGTRQLLDIASENCCRWVQLSSVGAYGPCNSGIVNELSNETPQGIYEKTKSLSDKFVRESGISYTILRPSIIFGTKMTNKSLFQLANLIRYRLFFLTGKDAIVNYVHVDDVVSALMLCAEHPEAIKRTFILSDSTTLESMVNSIADGLNVKHPNVRIPYNIAKFIVQIFNIVPRFPLTMSRLNALNNHCIYDSFLIKSELDFSFNLSLDEAFQNYAKSIRN